MSCCKRFYQLDISHSFPTRRSSDLVMPAGALVTVPVPVPPFETVSAKVGVKVTVKATFADRKSTRLNSSHANISYAVFCLKKKKRHYDTEDTTNTAGAPDIDVVCLL